MDQPRIYYGESGQGDFVVANANGELDFEGSNENLPYSGQGGIPIENIFRRALFAWNFKDVNLLLSNQITNQSRLMIYRDVEARAAKAVPFLAFDSDPYLAIIDGEPKWILDAYTSTDQYPYSQSVSASAATEGLLSGSVNYMRNSVKVVVDAYQGTVTYYANLSEPIVAAWSSAYPGLFTDINTAPASLAAHFRYPENLFQIQAFQFANYHVSDPTAFYQRRDFWQISPDPTQPTSSVASGGTPPPMRPYYQLIKVPGGATEQFQLVIPFVPAGRQNMVGWMSANSDPLDYGHVTMFRSDPEHRGTAAGVRADQQRSAVLLGADVARPAGLRDRFRRLPRDPDRRLVPVRAADLRAVDVGPADPRAEAGHRRQRQRR